MRSSRPEMFCKKGVLRNFAKLTGKHLWARVSFLVNCRPKAWNFIKKETLRPATLLKKRLWYRCFPVNFAEFLRTPFLTEYIRWLLLYFPRYRFLNWQNAKYETFLSKLYGLTSEFSKHKACHSGVPIHFNSFEYKIKMK